MCRIAFSIFFLFFTAILFSQETTKLKGEIKNILPEQGYINIINLTQETGTVNSATGEFVIEVREGDTLRFSSIQFTNKEITITAKILEDDFLEVELEKSIDELDEVQVSNIGLSGNLERDLDKIETHDPNDFGFPSSGKPAPTIVERKISGMSKPTDPVGVLSGLISGERGKLKQARENQQRKNFVYEVRELFPETIFTDELNLPTNEIINFLYYCAEDARMKTVVETENNMELLEFYKKKVSGFIERRELD